MIDDTLRSELRRTTAMTAGTIKHVIVLMLENRSFDHLLAYSGIPGLQYVDTTKTNPGVEDAPVAMNDAAPDRAPGDPGHEFEDVDWEIFRAPYGTRPRPITLTGFVDRGGDLAMQCAAPTRVPVFTHLARNFMVCDQWFSSMPGPTWPNRFFVHAGSSGGLANSPSGITTIGSLLWSKLGFSFQNGTIFDRLGKAKKSWRVYHGDHFPQVCAINTMPSIFVASTGNFRSTSTFAADAAAGDVANYTFIEPDYSILSTFRNGDSQHPSGTLSAGEQLIADVANAVIASSAWMSSLLLVLYDEHGGFYDQAPPAAASPPGDSSGNARKAAKPPNPPFGFDRYGIRVPAIVVSPWVKPGSVSHATYDHSSVIRTVFDLLDVPGSLTARDQRATSLKGALLPEGLTEKPVPLPPPAGGSDTEAPSLAPRESLGSLNGFTRIAATVHHAIRKYVAHVGTGSRPELLARAIQSTDDLSYLPGLPRTPDPNESRSYIAVVAQELQEHRLRQRQSRTP